MGREQTRRWDVFLSYARRDAEGAGGLAALLRRRGLSVFVDEADASGFSSLDAQLRDALARSTVLVAFYSDTYPRRPSCQFELTTAFLAGQREGDSRRRIAVVNPQAGPGHIVPAELRDVRHWAWPFGTEEAERFLRSVSEQAGALSTPIGTVPTQVPGFAGRYRELWRLHSELTRPSLPLSAAGGPKTCLVTGLPGIGKTALARQYAALFGSAFPGGVVWGSLADAGAPQPGGLTVLDVPPGVSGRAVAEWLRRRPAQAATLVLAEDRLELPTAVVSLSGLDDAASFALLTGSRQPADDADAEEARLLAGELGGHPQALLLAGSAARSLAVAAPYKEVRRAWLSGEIGGSSTLLPDGYRADPLPSLLRKVSALPPATMDVVRVLSILPPQLCGGALLSAVWTAVGGAEPLAGALESAARHGLCVHREDGSWWMQPLVRLLAHRLETDPARRQLVKQAAWLSAADYSGGLDFVAGGIMTASALSQAEQEAVFRLQTELASRVSTVPLPDEDGFLREALSSMKTVLQTARESLASLAAARRSPEVVTIVRGVIEEIRPLLSRWHPLLSEHESLRPADVGVRTHERNWEHNAQLRRELAALQARLREIEGRLEELTGTQLSFDL